MSVLTTLPARPLDHASVERIRNRRDVEAVISIGTTTIHERRSDQLAPVTAMMVLAEGVIYELEYDVFGWSKELVETDATRRDHLEHALDRLEAGRVRVSLATEPSTRPSDPSDRW